MSGYQKMVPGASKKGVRVRKGSVQGAAPFFKYEIYMAIRFNNKKAFWGLWKVRAF